MYVGAQHGQVCASGQTEPPSQVKRPGDILMLENQGFHLVLSKRASQPFPQGGSPGSWVPLTTRGKKGRKMISVEHHLLFFFLSTLSSNTSHPNT